MSNEMMNQEVQEAVNAGRQAFRGNSDYLVQSKIEDAREQVDDAIRYIEEILNGLQGQRKGEV